MFIQWLEGCSCGAVAPAHGIVRLYALPLAPLMDGLPGQPWVWCCNFTVRAGKAVMHAALTAPPPGTIKLLFAKARELGVRELMWDRVEANGVRAVNFSL